MNLGFSPHTRTHVPVTAPIDRPALKHASARAIRTHTQRVFVFDKSGNEKRRRGVAHTAPLLQLKVCHAAPTTSTYQKNAIAPHFLALALCRTTQALGRARFRRTDKDSVDA